MCKLTACCQACESAQGESQLQYREHGTEGACLRMQPCALPPAAWFLPGTPAQQRCCCAPRSYPAPAAAHTLHQGKHLRHTYPGSPLASLIVRSASPALRLGTGGLISITAPEAASDAGPEGVSYLRTLCLSAGQGLAAEIA